MKYALNRSLLLIFGLLFSLLTLSPVLASKEDLPAVTVEGKPEGSTFQDLFRLLLEVMEEQGYVFLEESPEGFNDLAMMWSRTTGDEGSWFIEELLLTDSIEQERPLEEREINAMYTAITGDPQRLRDLDSSLAEIFGIKEVDLVASATDNIEDWGTQIEIEGTRSILEYYYTPVPDPNEVDETAVQHTLSAEIKPIGYEQDSLLEALPSLADYLYDASSEGAETYDQYFVSALIERADMDEKGITYHSLELIKSSLTDNTFVRHAIGFNSDVSLEDSRAAVSYLEEYSPDHITGLTEQWVEMFKQEDSMELNEEKWGAGLSGLPDAKGVWLIYMLEE